jgi:hypothetical protein
VTYGSRVLNDSGSVLGLNIYDLIGAVAALVITSELLRPVGLEFLSVIIGILSLVFLVPIRLKFRRKIIRDTVGFYIGSRRITVTSVGGKNA